MTCTYYCGIQESACRYPHSSLKGMFWLGFPFIHDLLVYTCFEHLLLGVAMGKRAEYLLNTCVHPAVSTFNRKQSFIAEIDASNVE